ncbi:hypothetical protein BLNAU_25040 [Blattamonas nauphoetae]|uniref:Uncharacterized protein n=1 Tax=Blattamonas nauphoetae TaxID=2049346 RepID=A0ABQ9WL41_9EUKA|nr:hypothetical protein BLNAU_25040 [Blattamonas nauphoetae]
MEFLVDSCQPSRTPSEHPKSSSLDRLLLNSAIDDINTRFSISDLTDLAFDVLFLSLLSIVSDEAFHKPARHFLARMFEMSEGELERLLLEREVRRGDLEMDWLGEGRTKEGTLSFAEGVWMLLGRRETEWERDEDTNEAATDEGNEGNTEQEPESVEYPRTVRSSTFHAQTSTPTVFLHRVACLLVSALFSAASDCLPSNHNPTASTDTTHNHHDSSDDIAICLKLTGWLQTTFEKWKSGSVFTKTVRMDVESAVSRVPPSSPRRPRLAMLPRLPPSHLLPLHRNVALFARLTPSLPHKLVRSVEYGVRRMLEGRSHSQYGCSLEEAAELCRPILDDLMNRLESGGKEEIAAQIWVIVSSNDYHLLDEFRPRVHLLSVLTDATDHDEAFFILRACTKPSLKQNPTSLFSPNSLHTLFHHPSIWEEDGQTTAGARGVETASPDADASVCTI